MHWVPEGSLPLCICKMLDECYNPRMKLILLSEFQPLGPTKSFPIQVSRVLNHKLPILVSGSLERVSKAVVQLCPQVMAGWLPRSIYALLVKMKDLYNILIDLIECQLFCLWHSVWAALTIHKWSYHLDMDRCLGSATCLHVYLPYPTYVYLNIGRVCILCYVLFFVICYLRRKPDGLCTETLLLKLPLDCKRGEQCAQVFFWFCQPVVSFHAPVDPQACKMFTLWSVPMFLYFIVFMAEVWLLFYLSFYCSHYCCVRFCQTWYSFLALVFIDLSALI